MSTLVYVIPVLHLSLPFVSRSLGPLANCGSHTFPSVLNGTGTHPNPLGMGWGPLDPSTHCHRLLQTLPTSFPGAASSFRLFSLSAWVTLGSHPGQPPRPTDDPETRREWWTVFSECSLCLSHPAWGRLAPPGTSWAPPSSLPGCSITAWFLRRPDECHPVGAAGRGLRGTQSRASSHPEPGLGWAPREASPCGWRVRGAGREAEADLPILQTDKKILPTLGQKGKGQQEAGTAGSLDIRVERRNSPNRKHQQSRPGSHVVTILFSYSRAKVKKKKKTQFNITKCILTTIRMPMFRFIKIKQFCPRTGNKYLSQFL